MTVRLAAAILVCIPWSLIVIATGNALTRWARRRQFRVYLVTDPNHFPQRRGCPVSAVPTAERQDKAEACPGLTQAGLTQAGLTTQG